MTGLKPGVNERKNSQVLKLSPGKQWRTVPGNFLLASIVPLHQEIELPKRRLNRQKFSLIVIAVTFRESLRSDSCLRVEGCRDQSGVRDDDRIN